MKRSTLLFLFVPAACFLVWILARPGGGKSGATAWIDESGPPRAGMADAHPTNREGSSAAAVPPAALPVAMPGNFWSFGKDAAGDVAGLEGRLAAESRGNSILPSGRRFRLENFPDIRTLEEGKRVDISLPDGRIFEGRVNWSKRDDGYADMHQVAIGFKGDMGGLVATNDGTTGLTQGRLLVEHDPIGWTLEPDKTGGLWLVEHLREDMICERQNPQAARSSELPGDTGVTGSGTVAPALNSRSTASAVLYIDFDGQPTQTYPDWPASNPGGVQLIVTHSGMTADQMTRVWRRVAEDYIQFNINVTTDPAKYTAAAVGSRMRILVGGTLSAGVNGAGLAIVRSFQTNAVTGYGVASNVPCWLEVSPNYGTASTMTDAEFSSLASNASHEFGHTLGLFHDGNDGVQPTVSAGGNYYPGHGTAPFDWSPIMGSPYRTGATARGIIQWSKKDYPGANNSQDDLAIISGTTNGFGYATDESTSFITASTLTTLGTDQVGGGGVIANNADSDWWMFQTTRTGSTTVTVEPADRSVSMPNLDCGFRIEDATGATVAGPFSTQDNLTTKATFSVATGVYYVVAYGTGNRQFSDSTGYNNYGSTGRYLVTVDLPADITAPVATVDSPADNSVITAAGTFDFHGTATDNESVTGLSIYLRRDADNAWWNGGYWQVGAGGAALARTYNGSTHAWSCTAALPAVGGNSANSIHGGNYAFIVIAEDAAGHSTQSGSEVTVLLPGPNVAMQNPGHNSVIDGFTSIYGTVTDTGGGIAGNRVNLTLSQISSGKYWTGSGWISSPTSISIAVNGSTWAYGGLLPGNATNELAGQYAMSVSTLDNYGVSSSPQSGVNNILFTVDTAPPVASISTPANGSMLTTASYTLAGEANDINGVQGVNCFVRRGADNLYWNGSGWGAPAVGIPTSYNGQTHQWTCTGSLPQPGGQLANGSYNFIAIATDTSGHSAQTDSVVTVDYHPTYTWTGLTFRDANPNNDSNDWSVPQNWSPNGVPGATDIAIIDNGDEVQSTVSRTVYGMNLISGKLKFTSGPGASGTLTTTKTAVWNDALFYGIWNTSAGSTLNLVESTIKLLIPGSVVNNAGTINWLGGYFRDNGSGGVVVNNLAGGTFKLAIDGSPFGDYYGGNTFNNAGTFVRTAGTSTVPIHSWIFNNSGVIRCDASVLQFNCELNLNAGSSFSGTAPIYLNSTTNVNAAVTLPATVTLTGGRLNCPGTGVTVSGDLQWADGSLNGRMDLAAGSRMTLTTGGLKLMIPGTVINNFGTIERGSDSGYFRDNGSGGVVINNKPGGVFKMTGDGAPFEDYYGGNTFNNAGTFIRTGGIAALSVHAWTFNNTGLIQCDAAEPLQFDSPLNLDAGSSFAGTGPIKLNSTTSINAPINIPSTVSLTGGGLNLPSTGVAVSGYFRWLDGYLKGRLDIPSGSTLVLAGDAIKPMFPGSVINNSGTMTWSGGNAYLRDNGSGGCVINNLTGGFFNAAGDGLLFEDLYGGNVFNNAGTFVRQSGTAALSIHSWAFNNTGTIRCNASTLRFDTTLSLNAGTTLVATSPIALNGNTIINHSSVQLPSNVSVTGGGLNIPTGVSPSISGNFTWAAGYLNGTLNVQPAGTLDLTGADIKPMYPGSVINNSGTMKWNGQGGYLRDAGSGGVVINNLAGASFNVLADGAPFEDYYGGNTFNNAGGFVKSGGTGSVNVHAWNFRNTGTISAGTGDIVFNGASVELRAGGVITGAKTVNFTTGITLLQGTTTNTTGHVVLSGTNLAGDATGTLAGQWVWTSGYLNGSVKVASNGSLAMSGADPRYLGTGALLENSGIVTVTDTGNLRGDGSSTIRNKANAVFNAAGTATFGNYYENNNFINDGTVTIGSPISRWSLDWSFTQSATGVLALDVAGPVVTDFDRLSVAGTATLGGTVSVTKLNGYAPSQGTSFAFLNANAGVIGSFATVNGGFNATYAAKTATLEGVYGLSFESWVATFDLTGQDTLPAADPDKDGMANFVEYAFNTNPTTGGTSPLTSAVTNIGGQDWLVLKYRRWADREITGLVYTPQSGTTLTNWSSSAPMVAEEDPGAAVITGSTAWRCRVPIGSGKSFLRVMVGRP